MSNQEQNTKTFSKPGGAMFGGNAAVPGEKQKTLKILLVNYCVTWANLKCY